MFKVISFVAETPGQLEDWLNKKGEEGLMLVSFDGDWYVFLQAFDISVFQVPASAKIDTSLLN